MLRISADPDELDIALIHDFLARDSYWAAGIPRETVERALRNSVCCGGYLDGAQVAFARAVTDQATFAYIADVFVLPAHRGRGFGRQIVAALLADPRLQGLRRCHLITRDMQALYSGFGFEALTQPDRHMQKHDPGVYRRAAEATKDA
jgi:N-acetylglutamate synthase-like GNAT family acetyltransferase